LALLGAHHILHVSRIRVNVIPPVVTTRLDLCFFYADGRQSLRTFALWKSGNIYQKLVYELSDLYSPRNIIWLIKSRRKKWAVLVARMGEKRDVFRVLVGKPEGIETTWLTQV